MTRLARVPGIRRSLRQARPLLGTIVDIRGTGHPARLQKAIHAAFAIVERVHRLMSFHDPESEVSLLNREAHLHPIHVSDDTWRVLASAQIFSEMSQGAFDITVAPALVAWGYLPETVNRHGPVGPYGYRQIKLLSGGRVRFLAPTLIDLGGIAKGYAVDCACEVLENFGITEYVVNAGGDLRVGTRPELIQVRHPRGPGFIFPLATIQQAAVATSAAYYTAKRHDGRLVHPLVTPHTGKPAGRLESVSVLARDCMTSDALTKVVAVRGVRAENILRRFNAQACLLTRAGEQIIIGSHHSTQENLHEN
jgi:thiamine biosynthesis lipoprotein